jgi:hypothetical protein
MHAATQLTLSLSVTTLIGALHGCAGLGAPYSEVMAHGAPVASDRTRIVMLRPNGRYDDYSLSRAVVRVNEKRVGGLAYGGFLYVDVEAGDVAIEASARNQMYGTCELLIKAAPGDTVYLDVGPRTANIVANVIGAAAGTAAVGDGPTHVGLDEILVDESTVPRAVGSTTGSLVGSAAESVGKECGGPFKLTPMQESAALKQLARLSWSG